MMTDESAKLCSWGRTHSHRQLLNPFIAMLLLASCLAPAQDQRPFRWGQPGGLEVTTIDLTWNDTNRTRKLPAKVYYPNSPGPFPLIIFSHGLGGSKEGYTYLGRHWASHGYISVHLQHPGSDQSVLRSPNPLLSMRQSAADPQNAVHRVLDAKFAIDQMLILNTAPGPLQYRLNTNSIGVAGHSFGAHTSLAVAGQTFGPREKSFADPRIKAAIAMSAPVPRQSQANTYRHIRIPVLHMTGTEDNSPIGDTTATERRIPFDRIQSPNQFLITFTGGDHMIFSGRLGVATQKYKAFQQLILLSSTAFWDGFFEE